MQKFDQYPKKLLLELTLIHVAAVQGKEEHSHYCERLYGTLESDFELTDSLSDSGLSTDWAVTILDRFLAVYSHLWTGWDFSRAI